MAARFLVPALRKLTLTPPNGLANNAIRSRLIPANPFATPVQQISFFNKLPAEQIWKGVTSVSNAGAKKGRGKGVGRKRIKDLNRGQVVGVGKANIVWPGLTSPILKGSELVKQQQLPEDTERQAKLIKLRDSMKGFKHFKLSPIERGWTGARVPGRKFGPPDPIGDDKFEGFETICLEFKALFLMRGKLGRRKRISTVMVTGNRNGIAGFAQGQAREGIAAMRMARNRAGQKLMYFDIFEGHTVYHDFFTQFGKTKIFVWKKPQGYGLQCHRVIKAICEVVGIKNLHAKVEGPTNTKHIIKAFFIGLLQQKSHEQLAEEKGLHLVEFRKENGYFPKVVHSPEVVRKAEEILPNEVLDFTQYALNDRVVLKKQKPAPFYTKMPHWQIYLRKLEKRRNHEKIRLDHLVEYGEAVSFLNKKHPDPVPVKEE